MNSSKSQNDYENNLHIDIISGAMNIVNKLGDKVPEFLKDVTEGFIRRNDAISIALAHRQVELVKTIEYASKVNDGYTYYSSLHKLFGGKFIKDTIKLVDKGEYSWAFKVWNIQI